MNDGPVLFDGFLGAGGFWTANLGAGLTPPVSWMGGKRRLAPDLLALLGLRVGRPVPAVLGDSSWWGWVWPTVLDAETGPRVSAILRGWREEDPRALWFRLRDQGPITDDIAGAAAQLLWLQARAASGVPVWWEERTVVSMDGHGRGPYPAWQATCRKKALLAAPIDLRELLLAALSERPPAFANEAQLQAILSVLLDATIPLGYRVEREVRLSRRDRLDFLVGPPPPPAGMRHGVGGTGIAVEVKVGGGLSDLTRQMFRYAEHPRVTGLLIVTTQSRHRQLPETVNGKPLAVLSLGDFLLAG